MLPSSALGLPAADVPQRRRPGVRVMCVKNAGTITEIVDGSKRPILELTRSQVTLQYELCAVTQLFHRIQKSGDRIGIAVKVHMDMPVWVSHGPQQVRFRGTSLMDSSMVSMGDFSLPRAQG